MEKHFYRLKNFQINDIFYDEVGDIFAGQFCK